VTDECDVLVVGSGAAGMLAAVRVADAGLRTVVIEKSDRYGGTSAVSGGGIWIPNNPDVAPQDNVELALTYLSACTRGEADETRLRAFLADGPRMVQYANEKAGLALASLSVFPDYQSRLPGAIRGRTVSPTDMDGKLLGEEYFKLRDSYSYLKLFGRLSLNIGEAGLIGAKAPGWKRTLFRMLRKYWLDIPWRRRTPRDRRLSNGQALVGRLRKAMLDRNIPLLLNTALVSLEAGAGGRVNAAVVEHLGVKRRVRARHGVILASGGFESNQAMRESYLQTPGSHRFSAPPRGINVGDGILAGLAQGAALGTMKYMWKAPVVVMPVTAESNVHFALPIFWDRAAPGSICVNRSGRRFVNECFSYDAFGMAMITDDAASGANLPCWMIFDASCRRRSIVGPLLPAEVMPDRKLPLEWTDSVFYRAESLQDLATKIGVDAAGLLDTVRKFNDDARAGVDTLFDRGGSAYDQFFGHPAVKPNGNLAPLETAPYYAIRLDLGDIGTKGGLRTDAFGRVLRPDGAEIAGLYAAGNTAASIFANSYPGAGGTLGPGLTQAFVAAEHIAQAPDDHT
jgi:3-oxosteroid 1-dehydrogenase